MEASTLHAYKHSQCHIIWATLVARANTAWRQARERVNVIFDVCDV